MGSESNSGGITSGQLTWVQTLTGNWAFFYFFIKLLPPFLHQGSVLNQVPQPNASLLTLQELKNSLTLLLKAKQAQHAQNGLKSHLRKCCFNGLVFV